MRLPVDYGQDGLRHSRNKKRGLVGVLDELELDSSLLVIIYSKNFRFR